MNPLHLLIIQNFLKEPDNIEHVHFDIKELENFIPLSGYGIVLDSNGQRIFIEEYCNGGADRYLAIRRICDN